MKRPSSFTFIVKILAVVMIATTLLAAFPIMNVSAANVTITLDPGHGGKDPGATGASAFGGKSEAQYVLIFCQYMKERLLQYNGATVHLTRTDDTFIELDTRPAIAKNHSSDAFISVHCNSFSDPNAHGTEVYTISSGSNYTASQKMASTVLGKILEATGNRNRGVKTANYAVLKGANNRNIPVGILIETGFVTNQGDYNRTFANDAILKKVAYAMADGVASYYGLSASGNLPSVDAPAVPTAPSYYSCVDHINGVGPNGAPNYAGVNGTAGMPATVDAVADGVPASNNLSVGGWMGVDGGTSHYVYSIDNGATWKKASGGYDGEPLPNHYSGGFGYSNATKMGMFHKDISPIVADLSAYAGQKLTVIFAAVSAKDSSFTLPFLKVTNYTVSQQSVVTPPAPPVPETPADPNGPVYSVGLDHIVNVGNSDHIIHSQHTSAAWAQDNSYVTLRTTGEDPYVAAVEMDASVPATSRLYIFYRTTSAGAPEFFVGSTGGWSGFGDHLDGEAYIADGKWHLMEVDLSASSAFNGKVANYLRYDYYTSNGAPAPVDASIDIKMVAFFDSAAKAEAYVNAKFGTSQDEHTCSFGAWRETKPATCTESGIRSRSCSCGKIETATIPVKTHTEGAWIVDVAAKPGVDGSKHIECTVCHLTLKTELIPALPIVTEPDVTTKDPVVTEPAVTEPAVTEPVVTEPTVTEPAATEPTVTEPEATEPVATEPEATEPEATEPEATEGEPEITKPEAKPPQKEKGCKSSVSGALAIVALTTAAGALCLARKRED